MAKKIELNNGRNWKTQKAAEDHFREIRDRHPLNTPIENPSDHDDLTALLERYDAAHPKEQSKIGVGIQFFDVRKNYTNGGNTTGFWITRKDGSQTDFSFLWAIQGIPKPESVEFSDACRATIQNDLLDAKHRFFSEYADAYGRVPCEITGNLIANDQAHLDHAYPTFGSLVITFRAARGWHHSIPTDVLTLPKDNQTTTVFAQKSISDAFRIFHHAEAQMRIISKAENLSRGATQQRPHILRPVKLSSGLA